MEITTEITWICQHFPHNAPKNGSFCRYTNRQKSNTLRQELYMYTIECILCDTCDYREGRFRLIFTRGGYSTVKLIEKAVVVNLHTEGAVTFP